MKAKGAALSIVLAVAVLFVCEAVAQAPADQSPPRFDPNDAMRRIPGVSAPSPLGPEQSGQFPGAYPMPGPMPMPGAPGGGVIQGNRPWYEQIGPAPTPAPFPAMPAPMPAAPAAVQPYPPAMPPTPTTPPTAMPTPQAPPTVDVQPAPLAPPSDATPTPAASSAVFGRYHALVIANQAYRTLPALKTPVADARAVAELLRQEYGFDDIRLLVNATRARIIHALDDLRGQLGPRDNLLIYYAGHGRLDPESDRGYWLPVDAEPDSRANWLSNADLTDALRALRAKHVLIVADSCYSGTLTRGADGPAVDARDIVRLAEKRARTVLTSGGLEPVIDAGKVDHSVFAAAFLGVLTHNADIADMTRLFSDIRRQVLLNAKQMPEYADIREAGHEGGDFIFVRRHGP